MAGLGRRNWKGSGFREDYRLYRAIVSEGLGSKTLRILDLDNII